jgi:hypothetical protein
LVQALDQVEPPTVADFFRLAAHKVRQALLDLDPRKVSYRWTANDVEGVVGLL